MDPGALSLLANHTETLPHVDPVRIKQTAPRTILPMVSSIWTPAPSQGRQKQQRVGRLLGHPLDVLPGDATLPRGLQHVLDAVLRDVGRCG